jgi:hypothetical protein
VFAIFEAGVNYLVCKPTRGVLGGAPILVPKSEVIEVEDFDA